MYTLAAQEILNKISKIFPGAMLCDVHSHSDLLSIDDFIEVYPIPLRELCRGSPCLRT